MRRIIPRPVSWRRSLPFGRMALMLPIAAFLLAPALRSQDEGEARIAPFGPRGRSFGTLDDPIAPLTSVPLDSLLQRSWSYPRHDADGRRELTFEHLAAFDYTAPEGLRTEPFEEPSTSTASFEERVPAEIRMLDETDVAIVGYLMPLAGTPEAMTKFLLVRNMMICCYAVVPKINEWVYVEADAGQKLRYIRDVPVLVGGELEVKESVESGLVLSLYRMRAGSMQILRREELIAFYDRVLGR
jgi:hypothetical protein